MIGLIEERRKEALRLAKEMLKIGLRQQGILPHEVKPREITKQAKILLTYPDCRPIYRKAMDNVSERRRQCRERLRRSR